MPQRDSADLMLGEQHRQVLLALLATHVPEADVWAYGSRVSGGAHEGSDLDLVLRHPAHLQQAAPGWLELKEALQDSLLPMLVDVHQWSSLPDGFHRNIEADYIVLQTGNAEGKGRQQRRAATPQD
jgi:uncharacterized protein